MGIGNVCPCLSFAEPWATGCRSHNYELHGFIPRTLSTTFGTYIIAYWPQPSPDGSNTVDTTENGFFSAENETGSKQFKHKSAVRSSENLKSWCDIVVHCVSNNEHLFHMTFFYKH